MAAIQINDVLLRVAQLLQDTTHIRWPIAEKLGHITDAVREVCFYKPEACAKTAVVSLVAGTRQVLPADGTTLLRVVRNMGVGGATAGAAPRIVEQEDLDAHVPGWHTATPNAAAKHYTFDPQDQKTFYVYPPQPAAGQGSLEIVYASEPIAAAEGATLLLDNTWLPAIENYTLYRCYAKDAEHAGNAQLAAAYYQAFNAQLGGRTNAEGSADANRAAIGKTPGVRSAA